MLPFRTTLILAFALLHLSTVITSGTIIGHIVPHSHDDVGFRETYQEYYDSRVRSIYTTVVQALESNPDRRFIAVECAFLYLWWGEASDELRQKMRNVVASGQLEFVMGGWTSQDEACTTYSANIDQMTLGHQFIVDRFGESAAPNYGWQIDPFGATNTVHSHFQQMGFNATVVDRITGWTKEDLANNRSLELIWQTSSSLGVDSRIFTHVMDSYRYPTAVSGLDWDDGDPLVNATNIATLANAIVENIIQRQQAFRTNNVMWTWGSDFLHFYARLDFDNMDKIVAYINQNSSVSGVSVRYSTLNDYFNAVADANMTWDYVMPPNDFLPYIENSGLYWTGFFTSHPALKYFTRSREALLRTSEILHVLTLSPWGPLNATASQHNLARILDLRRSTAIMTHHDAITGTSPSNVVFNYEELLQQGTDETVPAVEQSFSTLGQTSGSELPEFSMDSAKLIDLLYDDEAVVAVSVFNSLAWSQTRFVMIACFQEDLVVRDASGSLIPFDVLPAMPIEAGPCQFQGTCGHGNPFAHYNLFFEASVGALGYTTYFVSVDSTPPFKSAVALSNITVVNNGVLELAFDPNTHLLQRMTNLILGQVVDISQQFLQYNDTGLRTNYVFQPYGPAVPIVSSAYAYEVVQGSFVTEIRQMFTPPCNLSTPTQACGIAQVYRLYQSENSAVSNAIEVLTFVGPLVNNTDFVSRYTTNMNTSNNFYTDDNCFNLHQRTLNMSFTFDPFGGNYYPMTCTGVINDSDADLQLTYLTDRTLGVSSLNEGQFEIMYHRRVQSGPDTGVELDDTDNLQNIRTVILFANTQTSTQLRKELQYAQQFPLTAMFASVPSTLDNQPAWPFNTSFSALSQPFPQNVHLLSLVQLNHSFPLIMLRIVHLYEIGDDPILSQPVTLTLADYFSFAQLTFIDERTLTGVHNASYLLNNSRFVSGAETRATKDGWSSNSTVTLSPTQIRTFFVEFS